TYSSVSRLTQWRRAGVFIASATILNTRLASGLRRMLAEIERLRTGRIGDAELRAAKAQLRERLGMRFEHSEQASTALTEMAIYARPADAFQSALARIDALTLEETARVAQRYLDLSQARIVVLGNATVQTDLENLRVGPVTVYAFY